MTISTNAAKSRYAGDGATANFPTGFQFIENAQVKVVLRAVDGNETVWVEGSEYSLSGAGAPGGGTVSVSTSPVDYRPALGETLVVKLAIAPTQATSLPLGGAFPSTAVEAMADLATLRDQQIEEALSRAVKFKESTALAEVELPEPAAGKGLRWNDAGDALMNAGLPAFHDGSGPPATWLGEVGDRYIDNDSGDIYKKVAPGSWALTGNIEGPAGPPGAQGAPGADGAAGAKVLFGSGVPDGSLGEIGDYYKDSGNGDYYEKTGITAWMLRGNDSGPAGPAGSQGDQGVQGIQGVPGADGSKALFGAGAPAGGLGDPGDYYKNTSNGDYYEKTGATVWTLRGNDTGPAGPAGSLDSAANGSVSAPSIAFANDTNTGIYRVGADSMGLVAGGLLGLTVSESAAAASVTLGGVLNGAGNAAQDVAMKIAAAKTASFTFAAAEAGVLTPCNAASAMTATVPPEASVAFTPGTTLAVWNQGAGAVTWSAGAGVTLLKDANLTLVSGGQHAISFALKVASDTWVVAGALEAA
jgi:hypothetical protein